MFGAKSRFINTPLKNTLSTVSFTFRLALLPRQTKLSRMGKLVGLSIASCVLLTGCSKYQMTVNEAVVYTPPTIITDFETEDPRLKNCLDQAIEDKKATDFGDITRLICSHAGLTSLHGIEAFYNLKQLKLSHNQLTSLKPIKFLSKLEVLLLNDNQLSTASELLNLPRLQNVKLENNPQLQCGDLHQLQSLSIANLELPSQCD